MILSFTYREGGIILRLILLHNFQQQMQSDCQEDFIASVFCASLHCLFYALLLSNSHNHFLLDMSNNMI